jgi:hypothetical protein
MKSVERGGSNPFMRRTRAICPLWCAPCRRTSWRTSLKRLERLSPLLLSYRTCASIAVQRESLNQRSNSCRSSVSSSGAVKVGHGSKFPAVPSTLAAQKQLIETICATSERASDRPCEAATIAFRLCEFAQCSNLICCSGEAMTQHSS